MTELADPRLIALLQDCKELPTPPAVATKIIELSGTQNSDIDTLGNIVAMDPALSAKILAMANSSLYMRRVETDTIQQAVAMFGWSGTLNIALGFAVMGSVRGSLSTSIDYDYVWKRSLAAAVSARKLAQLLKCKNQELVFLSALLQDLGILVLDTVMPDLYADIGDKQYDHVYLQNLEHEKIETDHAAIGAWLLERWNTPEEVSYLVGLSHGAKCMECDDLKQVQKAIYLSSHLADCLLSEETFQDFKRIADLTNKHINIEVNDFFPLLGQIAAQFEEMAAVFNVELGNTSRLQSIQEFSALSILSG